MRREVPFKFAMKDRGLQANAPRLAIPVDAERMLVVVVDDFPARSCQVVVTLGGLQQIGRLPAIFHRFPA